MADRVKVTLALTAAMEVILTAVTAVMDLIPGAITRDRGMVLAPDITVRAEITVVLVVGDIAPVEDTLNLM